jgi:hypothetical protein
MFSAGQGSFRASLIDRRRHPDAELRLAFTDTLYEDADAYRFLIEGAAQVLDRPLSWTVRADEFPDYRVGEDVPIEEYAGNPEWRRFLADLRARTIDALPELTWIVEGRDPWEIFRDRRFIGNSGVDPCSEVAKRLAFADWRSANCHRIGELYGDPDVFIVGIGFDEAHRFEGDAKGPGIRARNAADGWIYEAPLIDAERAFNKGDDLPSGVLTMLFGPLGDFGPAAPRLYDLGYMHNNCGGFCCKAGQAHWANRFRVQPERFAYDAMMERKVAAFLGKDVAMLTDRRGGKKPMTLDTFAARLCAEPAKVWDYEPGESGCGCMGVAA